jgi:hypothetical protein
MVSPSDDIAFGEEGGQEAVHEGRAVAGVLGAAKGVQAHSEILAIPHCCQRSPTQTLTEQHAKERIQATNDAGGVRVLCSAALL